MTATYPAGWTSGSITLRCSLPLTPSKCSIEYYGTTNFATVSSKSYVSVQTGNGVWYNGVIPYYQSGGRFASFYDVNNSRGSAGQILGSSGSSAIWHTVNSGLLEWTRSNATLQYAPYTAKGAGHLYTGSTNPTSTNRLNYDGYFYATKLYSGGNEVLTTSYTPPV
jgi:hypothetical protein